MFLAEDYGINQIFPQNRLIFSAKIVKMGVLTCDYQADVEG
jgi:hypothetical protein